MNPWRFHPKMAILSPLVRGELAKTTNEGGTLGMGRRRGKRGAGGAPGTGKDFPLFPLFSGPARFDSSTSYSLTASIHPTVHPAILQPALHGSRTWLVSTLP